MLEYEGGIPVTHGVFFSKQLSIQGDQYFLKEKLHANVAFVYLLRILNWIENYNLSFPSFKALESGHLIDMITLIMFLTFRKYPGASFLKMKGTTLRMVSQPLLENYLKNKS